MAGKTTADHLTAHEQSRQALEYSQDAHQHTQAATTGHGIAAFGHDDIAALAYELWKTRGCPDGSPQEDWFHAAEDLRSRTGKVVERKEEKRDETKHERSDRRKAS